MTIRRFKPAVKIAVLLFLTAAATGAGYQLWRRCAPPPQSMPPAQALPVEPSGTSTETTEPEPSGSIRRENCYTFLLVASDQVSGNADVIMLATYDMAQQTLGIVSIPRDTLLEPGRFSTFPKLNSVYLQGPEQLRAAVSDLTGIPIDYYVTVNPRGFVELVDTLGGITFDVPIHMSYEDPHQDLSIHFEPGIQHLSGADALKVCRLRQNSDGTLAYPDYDIGRTRTQQQMLSAILKKALLNPQKLPEYMEIFNKNVQTDLSPTTILWFIEPALGLENIQSATLPGNGEVTCGSTRYCYQLYPQETLELLNQLVNPYEAPLKMEDLTIYQISTEQNDNNV